MKRAGLAAVLLAAALAGPVRPAAPRAPLYWSAYEYCFVHDAGIPEAEWAAHADLVERALKPHGYRMLCIDGWGDDSRFNEHGYRTHHARDWKHDYAWWAAHLRARGMELGIYNNPLWVIQTAADAGLKVQGTDIPLKSLIDPGEDARWFKWVQVDRPGAEQYVKGYVRFYAAMGVRFLRVDFLSWFEDGKDRNYGRVGPNRPRAHYETALRWMREACDESGMTLSLVMPHLYDEAALEARYGHMFRVNEDAGTGGWERWNDLRRGERTPIWSQYGNAMDGLAHWSRLSGRGKVVLDADFLRLNTFETDHEKRTAVSACLVAGAPVAATDRRGLLEPNLWAYTNDEMLALNRDGFVGKPLSHDPRREDSQTWTGRMKDGDHVVAFFNREDAPRVRSLEFSKLGVEGTAWVRDLWARENLGRMVSYRVTVPPHGCVVIRVSSRPFGRASAVRFSAPGGVYGSVRTVALSSREKGATIRYTLDGSTPKASSPVYRKPVAIAKPVTLKAVAWVKGLQASPVAEASYEIRAASALAAPWRAQDIGDVRAKGTASRSGAAFTLAGSGADIEGTSDAFHFVSAPAEEDFTLTARLERVSPTHPWAKAGLMVRAGGPGAPNAFLGLASSHGLVAQGRASEGGRTTSRVQAAVSGPLWLRITRAGGSIAFHRSDDGKAWELVEAGGLPELRGPVHAGLAVTSHRPGTLASAVFTGVALDAAGQME